MYSAVIGIGSNINANQNINEAMNLLTAFAHIVRVSEIIVTKPIGIVNQPDFSNGAVLVQTSLDKEILQQKLKQIEDDLGRDRSRPKYGPREIDLDIIIFDDVVVDDDYYTRDFLKKLVDDIWV